MEAPNPNKRLRRGPPSSSGPSSLPTVPDFNQNHVDLIISSFLSLPDLPLLSSSRSVSNSFDRAIEKLLESSADESVQDRINDRGLRLDSPRFFTSLRKGALGNSPILAMPVPGPSLMTSPSL
ncbi:F-box protein [Raphanus sativus]|nr:F-box protein [Raphanus sativus]